MSSPAERRGPQSATGVLYKVAHCQQRASWDCGLACVKMLLDYANRDDVSYRDLELLCQDGGIDKSLWTIDLCLLLHRFRLKFVFTTTTLGVDPTYAEEKYYQHAIVQDRQRVSKAFEKALGEDLFPIKKTSSSVASITAHLRQNGPCLVLVNANLLKNNCDQHSFQRFFRACCSGGGGDGAVTTANVVGSDDGKRDKAAKSATSGVVSFQGHFILLVGCDDKEQNFSYHNPSASSGPSDVSYNVLDQARVSHGTDEDIIYVFKR